MPSEKATEVASQRPPGKLAAAWRVLRGEDVVPAQIRVEWAEYQLAFGDLINRLSAMLARQAKAEKRRAEQLAEFAAQASTEQEAPATNLRERKAQLRRRVFGGRVATAQDAARAAVLSPNGSHDE